MTTDTKQLIQKLAADAGPVQRPAGPVLRALMWLAISLAYVGLFVILIPTRHVASTSKPHYLFVTEQVAALATGLAAAIAAFLSVVPGYGRYWSLLPIVPFAVWTGSLGPGCVEEWDRFGMTQLPLSHSPWCVPFIILFGALPAIVMTIMLRRGAPLTPRLTAALGGLAAAGLANVGVRIVHPEDVSIMLLVWHIGGVMILSAVAGACGRYFFNWSSLIKKSKIFA
jgi:hypothetical protein